MRAIIDQQIVEASLRDVSCFNRHARRSAKPQLNGHCGIVVGYVESSGKCIVVLGGSGGKTKTNRNPKPENLKWK